MSGTPSRVWRTQDGRHVVDGHPDAAFLAYAAGDKIPPGLPVEPLPAAPVVAAESPQVARKQPLRTK